MRLLLVTADLSDGGGVNRVISHLTYMFSEMPGMEIDVFHAREFRGSTYAMPECVNIVGARRLLPRIAPLNLFLNLLRLRFRRYDHVLSFWTQENMVTAAAFAGSRTNVILSEHLSHDQCPPAIRIARRWTYLLADKLLVLNDQEFRYYSAFLRQVQLLPNPVIRPGQLPLPPRPKQNLILGIGHLTKRKGFRYLIEAAIAANVGDAGWRVKIIGAGPEAADLQVLIDAHHASAFISIEPPSRSVEDWYRTSRLIVVPSLTEVFSMVIPEAMAHEVVPVAFSTDGPSHILKRHPDLLVPIKDVDALATQLRRLMEDPGLSARGTSLRAEALDRFSYDALSPEWRRLLAAT